jgi:holin-like protein
MILHLATLLFYQLVGEVISRALNLPLPGPVIGMALLFLTLTVLPRVAQAIAPTTKVLLAHLSLLFVPAGVGVVGHLDRFGSDGVAIMTALILSTILAILAGVGVFLGLARLTGASSHD